MDITTTTNEKPGTTPATDDDALNLARTAPDGKPKLNALQQALFLAIGQAGAWWDNVNLAEDYRWCLWANQTDDGRKWAQRDKAGNLVAGAVAPEPYDGAHDARIRLVDQLTRETGVLQDTAWRRGRLKVTGLEGKDAMLAGKTSVLLRWQIGSQMGAEAETARKLAREWRNMHGASVTMVDWIREQALELTTVTREDLAEALGLGPAAQQAQGDVGAWLARMEAVLGQGLPANATAAQAQQFAQLRELVASAKEGWELATDPGREAELIEVLAAEFPPAGEKRLKQAAAELYATGTCQLPREITLKDRPRWRALRVFDDVFFPTNTTTDLQSAEWVAVREWLTEAQLREKAHEGWDDNFIAAALKTKGNSSTQRFGRRRLEQYRWRGARQANEADDIRNLVEVFHFFYRAADEDGVPGLYRTTCSLLLALGKDGQYDYRGDDWPATPDDAGKLYAEHDLSDYANGKMPFKAHVYYTESARLIDAVGIPWLTHTHQNEVKAMRDARLDAADLAIRPQPVRFHRDADEPVEFGPGNPIYERIPNSFRWAQSPNIRTDVGVELENATIGDACRIVGTAHPAVPATVTASWGQWHADEYLDEMEEVLTMTLQLDQQYMPDVLVTRVTGPYPVPFPMAKEDIRGAFDIEVKFDARSMDSEFMKEKFAMLAQIAQFDKNGQLNSTPILYEGLADLDPSWAEDFMTTNQAASQQEVTDEQHAIALMMTGQQPQLAEKGVNFQLRLQELQRNLQQNPVVRLAVFGQQPNVAPNPAIKALFAQREQNLMFGVQQQQNAVTGRFGVSPDMPPAATTGGQQPMLADTPSA